MSRVSADRSDVHYDNITQAWRYLMGESFHYGFFDPLDAPLDPARQHAVIEAALRVLENFDLRPPVLVDYELPSLKERNP